MTEEELKQQTAVFASEVSDMRAAYEACLQKGMMDEALKKKLSVLKKEEEILLEASVPLARSILLQRSSLHVKREMIAADLHALNEADLAEPVRKCIDELLVKEEPGMPDIPETASGFQLSQAQKAQVYLSIRNEMTCFLFLETGEVMLMEYSHGWQCRKKPLVHDCLAENACMESNRSCLLLNMDHQIERISYQRIETGEDVSRLEPFEMDDSE